MATTTEISYGAAPGCLIIAIVDHRNPLTSSTAPRMPSVALEQRATRRIAGSSIGKTTAFTTGGSGRIITWAGNVAKDGETFLQIFASGGPLDSVYPPWRSSSGLRRRLFVRYLCPRCRPRMLTAAREAR